MKMNINKSILLVTVIAGLAVMAMGKPSFLTTATDNVIQEPSSSDTNRDDSTKVILEELARLNGRMNMQSEAFYMDALFSAYDKTDTIHALNDIPYTLYKKKNSMYLRYGVTEVINDADLYVFVDHGSKKMIIQPAKQMQQPNVLPITVLSDLLNQHGYSVTKTITGKDAMVSLKNPNSLSCKEYSVSYDTTTKMILSIRTVIADSHYNHDESKDKYIKLKIINCDTTAQHTSLLQSVKFLHVQEGKIVPAEQYADYEIIKL